MPLGIDDVKKLLPWPMGTSSGPMKLRITPKQVAKEAYICLHFFNESDYYNG